jgi:hypothetical protein
MKIFKTIIRFITLFLLFFTSCEKDATNLRLPDFKQKLVINSFISPDKPVTDVTISSAQRIFGNLSDRETLGNLNAFISDGTKETGLDITESDTTDPIFKFSTKDMIIKEGNTYHLRVISDRGLTAEASCTVPVKRDFKIEVDTVQKLSNDPFLGILANLTLKVSITDFPGESNYYRVLYNFRSYGGAFGSSISSGASDNGDVIYTDKGRDGKKFVLRSLEPISFAINPAYSSDSSFLIVYLLNTDKAYYDFHQSLLNYSLGDQPFTEPSQVYSNVSGGLGIFAAYTVDSLRFRIK